MASWARTLRRRRVTLFPDWTRIKKPEPHFLKCFTCRRNRRKLYRDTEMCHGCAVAGMIQDWHPKATT